MKAIKEKLPDTREEWLAQRARGLGGSDAGAVMGVNPYKSPYTLWAEKTGIISSHVPDNEAMRFGRDMEDYVARRFCEETGKKVQRSGFSFQSDEHPFMLANIDRKIIGENAALECKTANIFAQEGYLSGQMPPSYYCQCLHYMAVCGFDVMYLASYIPQKGLHIFAIDRADPAVAADLTALIEAEADFWQLVETRTQPAVDGSESTKQTLGKLFSKKSDKVADLVDLDENIARIDQLSKAIRDLKAEQETLRSQIMDRLLEAGVEEAWTTDKKITWKTRSRTFISSEGYAALCEDYPEIADKYSTTSESRTLTIRKKPKSKKGN